MTSLENLFLYDQEMLKELIAKHLDDDDDFINNIINEVFLFEIEYRFDVSRTMTDDGVFITSDKTSAHNFSKYPNISNKIVWADCPEENSWLDYDIQEETITVRNLALKNPSPEAQKYLDAC